MAVNLKDALIQRKKKSGFETDMLSAVEKILAENELQRTQIRNTLNNNDNTASNLLVFDLLDKERIFHVSHIKKICIDYRLRFLDSHMFKHNFPEEAITEIHELERRHHIKLGGFKIVAPTKAFHLLNYNDPMLFAPLGNDYYYLVHQWGDDLSSWRKWLVMPFRNIGTFTFMCFFISLLLTFALPINKLGQHIRMASIIIFLFAFKSVFAVFMYGFFMGGRKFSSGMWNSKYFNN